MAGCRYLLNANYTFRIGAGRTFNLEERKRGLYFEAYLSEAPDAQAIRQKIKEGILDRLSFGFSIVKEAINRTTGVRELLELKLHEISVVLFPANPEAAIATVKAEVVPVTDSKLLRDFRATLASIKARPVTTAPAARQRATKADLLSQVRSIKSRRRKSPFAVPAEARSVDLLAQVGRAIEERDFEFPLTM